MKPLHIVHLYPNEMNTYGDRGNLWTLMKRAKWHGYQPVISYYSIGDTLPLPDYIDIVIGGGGQDSAQTDIQNDILRIGPDLKKLVEAGTPMLMVCGCYQLFANRFLTHDGQDIKGIGIFDAETIGSEQRLIGNIKVETTDFGTLYGFENHSGLTTLAEGQAPFGTIVRGNGNNGTDKTEGARTHNTFGTYMHGPFLPNNPVFADHLIQLAVEKRYGTFTPAKIDDTLSDLSRNSASNRKY